ncbi:hypothetical protein L596_019413 [Steinernema carpocapsae]|uniref:Uncharacterized protein n=1 Tax=Steinernema carpocapsae TaxID=34508 RepID=A0A4U5MQG5_STECR|nr:hypothetical protein L596_019413 [Steinernema carpocapsae]
MWCRGVAVAVSAVFLLSVAAFVGASSTESQQSRNRFNERHNVITEDGNGDCPMKDALHNASLQLSGQDLVQFQSVVEEIEVSVIGNASLSMDMQISLCGFKLRKFFKMYQSIALKIQFFGIAGFGSFDDFCGVADQVDGNGAEDMTVVENGDCEITRALKAKCASAGSANEQHQCKWLQTQINTIVTGSYEYQYRMVLIEKVFIQFEVQFSASDFDLYFGDLELGSFGCLAQFRTVCKQFYRFANIHNLFIGGRDCALLQGLNASAQDTSANWTRTERTQILDFISSISIYVEDSSLSDFVKMQKVCAMWTQFLMTFKFMQARMCILVQIGAEFDFGVFGDFMGCFNFMSVDQQGFTGVPGAPVSGAPSGSPPGFTPSGATGGFSEVSEGFTSSGATGGFSEVSGISGVSGGFTPSGPSMSPGFSPASVSGGVSEVTASPAPGGSVSPGVSGSPKPESPSGESIGRFDGVHGLVDCSKGGAEFTVLVKALVNMSSSLSGSDQTDWLSMVYDVRDHIICNASLSEDEMIIHASYKIKGFCSLHISIKQIVQYMFIGSWGMLNDFFNVAITLNGKSCQSVIIMSGGKCEFTAAIEAEISSFPVEVQADCKKLVADLNIIFSSTTLTFSQMMTECQFKMLAFFKIHASFKAQFMSIEIGSWGSIEMFLDVTMAWYRFFQFEDLFSIRSGESSCKMVMDMTADCNNASYGLTRAEQSSTLDFISLLEEPSQNASLSMMERAKVIIYHFKQFMMTNNFLFAKIRGFSIDIEVLFGFFGDFLDCYDIMSVLNGGATDVPSLPPTTPAATSPAVTTPAATTQAPTTSAAPVSTTPAPGNCSSYGPLFKLVSNHSIVVDSLYTACAGYNGTQCTNFKPYILKIDNGVVRNSTLTSDGQRLSFFSYIVQQYCGTNALRLYFVMNSQMSNGWGSVKQMCDCNSQSG